MALRSSALITVLVCLRSYYTKVKVPINIKQRDLHAKLAKPFGVTVSCAGLRRNQTTLVPFSLRRDYYTIYYLNLKF